MRRTSKYRDYRNNRVPRYDIRCLTLSHQNVCPLPARASTTRGYLTELTSNLSYGSSYISLRNCYASRHAISSRGRSIGNPQSFSNYYHLKSFRAEKFRYRIKRSVYSLELRDLSRVLVECTWSTTTLKTMPPVSDTRPPVI